MKKVFVFCFLSAFVQPLSAQTKDTFEIYFPFNETKISKEASSRIDQLIFKDVLIPGQRLIVLGYADYVGGSEYNEALSTARARSVQDYLVSSAFTKKDIRLCIGKGKINREPVNGPDGYAEDRKVQIIIDRHPDTTQASPDIAYAKVNETIALKNLLFVGNKDTILPQSYPELDRLLAFLKNNKTTRIQIEGHICCTHPGEPDMPYKTSTLSEYRARAVYDYLVQHGIDKRRLKYIGLGGTKPLITPEKNDDDRQQNRRVEVRIMSR